MYEPLLHVITAISPIVRGINWLGYQSGLIQLETASGSFAGTETREQLDFASRYYYRSSPAVVAREMLGMLHWDASDVLAQISIPVLIVSGGQDTTTLPAASAHMSAVIPHISRLSVNPAAHLGLIEQHERYNAAVETFALSGCEVKGRQAGRQIAEFPAGPWAEGSSMRRPLKSSTLSTTQAGGSSISVVLPRRE